MRFLKPILLISVSVALLGVPRMGFGETQGSPADFSIAELNQRLDAKRQSLKELQNKIEIYSNKVRETRQKALTLSTQIEVADANIDKTQLSIQTKELEIEQFAIEIELILKQIEQEEDRIGGTKSQIHEVLHLVHRYDARGELEMLFTSRSFSELLDQLYYTEVLGTRLRGRLDLLQSVRQNLKDNQTLMEQKRQEADDAREKLDTVRDSLEEEKNVKEILLKDTKASESEFQSLLRQLQGEQSSIDSEIVTLEKTVREKLKAQEKLKAGSSNTLTWPVNSSRGISAYFHDPDYPFRYVFEHPAVDIRVSQGTPIAAAADGYVARAKDGGMDYSYVMIIHSDGIASVYGHVSSIYVKDGDAVKQGQIIAASGGAPRTRGAGRLTTGPHLHFEVRLNGIPVDPLRFLPAR